MVELDSKFKRLMDDLAKTKAQPMLFVAGANDPEAVYLHLKSMAWGIMLVTNGLTFDDVFEARCIAYQARGWKLRASGPHVEMNEKGMSDEASIGELIDIEVEIWRILRDSNKF